MNHINAAFNSSVMHTPYIADIIGENVARVSTTLGRQVFYYTGREADVSKAVVEKSGANTQEGKKKSPLVWLVSDFEELEENYTYTLIRNLVIVIATETQPGLSPTQRRDQSFIPTLYPIYEALIAELQRDVKLRKRPLLTHTKTNRHYWDAAKDGNMFNLFLDAIVITNLNLQISKTC